jgi:hypothetical protein
VWVLVLIWVALAPYVFYHFRWISKIGYSKTISGWALDLFWLRLGT